MTWKVVAEQQEEQSCHLLRTGIGQGAGCRGGRLGSRRWFGPAYIVDAQKTPRGKCQARGGSSAGGWG